MIGFHYNIHYKKSSWHQKCLKIDALQRHLVWLVMYFLMIYFRVLSWIFDWSEDLFLTNAS